MDSLDKLERDLRRLVITVEEGLNRVAGMIWLPHTRRVLMAFKDDLTASLAALATKVQRERDLKAALKTEVAGLQSQVKAQMDEIARLQAMPGAWTDEDIAGIAANLQSLHDALDADQVVADVVANTPAEGNAG